ncbi:YajG family lipoprotein [Shewanella pneumatophori]|uniref:YajG family lipoprotein n=1 Tax=Shewanella pneumatophori TaxID=314092 RepID=A0A9X2CFZ0_9GAMM|nr:YajG family lipoprotein [Shewanella pneumatophori]MCL1138376.1 YajG family lipoprotein [Shewanella pneumatophori]
MKSLLLILTTTLTMVGCASQGPSHIALNPEVPAITVQTETELPVALETIDTRSANFIVRFNDGDKAARLVSPTEAPRVQMDQVFRQGFTQAGYRIDPSAVNHMQIQLEQLLTDVHESTFGFEANSQVIINVIAKNANQELTKRYRAKGLLKGPLGADFATLELEMNKLIGELTRDIINDPELNQFIQQ